MKRFILSAVFASILGLAIAPAFAQTYDFRDPEQIKKFWEDQRDRQGSDGGGAN